MHSLGALLLGFLNIVLLAAVLMLFGAIARWVLAALGWEPPPYVQKGYLAVVALIVLIAIVALLLGSPVPFRPLG
jgi:hypothetical protein